MSLDCDVALPRDATGLFAVCDCGISRLYLLFLISIAKSVLSGHSKIDKTKDL